MSQKEGRHPNPYIVVFPNKGNEMVHGGFLLGPEAKHPTSEAQFEICCKDAMGPWVGVVGVMPRL